MALFKSKKVMANVAMGVSKFFSGLNENALRFLLPGWMNAMSGVVFRMGFGAVAFWIISLFRGKRNTPITLKQKLILLALGALPMYGYMIFLLYGLSYTTPIASSIFISLEPVVVFILCVLFYHERVTAKKMLGIALGLGGALLIICTQKQSDVASDPLLGDLMCAGCCLCYSTYLVLSARLVKKIDNITVSKWQFTGGAISAIAVVLCAQNWHAPVLEQGLFSTPMLVLAFVLIFPSCISYMLVDTGLRYLSTTVVALYGYLILIVATIMSYVLGQDHFDWFQIGAIALIIASVYFVEVAESHDPANSTSSSSSK